MSKNEKTAFSEFSNPVELLYCDYGKTEKHSLGRIHSHDYWQIEFILFGSPQLEIGRKKIMLFPGDTVIIPPNNPHRFNYFRRAREGWSFKFRCNHIKERLAEKVVKDERECEILKNSLIELATDNPNVAGSIAISYALLAFVEKNYRRKHNPDKNNYLIQETRKFIHQRQRKRADAHYIAEKMGYSADYFSTLFKNETGTQLKKFIDLEIHKTATRMLKYSDYPISEIADKLGFPDQFTFSHFFKRISGKSPKQFRISEK
jgi:AraC-like DNA-binding protein